MCSKSESFEREWKIKSKRRKNFVWFKFLWWWCLGRGWGSEKTLAWIIISITKSHKFYELSSYKTFWSSRPFKWLLFLEFSWKMNRIWYLCNVFVFPMLIIRLMNCCLFIFVHTQIRKSLQNIQRSKMVLVNICSTS